MVLTYLAPLRAVSACALAGACAFAAAQNAPANVADPQAAVPAVRYQSAFTDRAETAPAANAAPEMAMHGMHMSASAAHDAPPAAPVATPPAPPAQHQHHAGMAMPAMAMPMPASVPKREEK